MTVLYGVVLCRFRRRLVCWLVSVLLFGVVLFSLMVT